MIENPSSRFGYVSPEICEQISSYQHFTKCTDLYTDVYQFCLDMLFLCHCEGNNTTIRNKTFPQTIDSSIVQNPPKCADIENARRISVVKNTFELAIRCNWSSRAISNMFRAFMHLLTFDELYNYGVRAPKPFMTVLSSLPSKYFDPSSIERASLNNFIEENDKDKPDDLKCVLDEKYIKGLPNMSLVCSRRFNRHMSNLIKTSFKLLNMNIEDNGVFTNEMYEKAKMISSDEKHFAKGTSSVIKMFNQVEYTKNINNNGGELFIVKVGDILEREPVKIPSHITGKNQNKTVYVWNTTDTKNSHMKTLHNHYNTNDTRADRAEYCEYIANHYQKIMTLTSSHW